MPSLSDRLLAVGVAHVEQIHGEQILILSGLDAGKTFTAVRETDSDIVFNEQLGEDRRAKRIIRFRAGNVPAIDGRGRVRTEDGKTWIAVRATLDGYLTTDFELREVEANDL